MCAGIPCNGQKVQLLEDFELRIPKGTMGTVLEEYLEYQEIVIECSLPGGTVRAILSADEDNMKIVEDEPVFVEVKTISHSGGENT
ncbi:MAG: hypothetical protein OXL96_27340 [Candidatus Poribacteria bacterium]|nr:hypothetical protein [Candidatus Poribacteria bacterium]